VTSPMSDQEISRDYEKNTGHMIVRSLQQINPSDTPGILVANHGPFAWGKDALEAAHNAAILEAIARMAYFTLGINVAAEPIGSALRGKHHSRKHGTNAYYGQDKKDGKS
jgi:L-ribulose-5-phosphate 4-epimerase